MEYKVIIPAAGMGKRMGFEKNKLRIHLLNKPIIAYTIEVFEKDPWCSSILLVINEQDRTFMEELVKTSKFSKVKEIVKGGQERQESVYKGLKKIEKESIVLVHDGARPFVHVDDIHKLVQVTSRKGAAVLAVPVKDTIKRVKEGVIQETLVRSELWSIQTPQAFHLSLLKQAYDKAEQEKYIGTDDASLVENMGYKVEIVKGNYNNIKITTQEDLLFAHAIINNNDLLKKSNLKFKRQQ